MLSRLSGVDASKNRSGAAGGGFFGKVEIGSSADYSVGLDTLSVNFQKSVRRLDTPHLVFQNLQNSLAAEGHLVEDLKDLADQSASSNSSDPQRADLNSQFQSKVAELNRLVNSSQSGTTDMRSKSQLEKLLVSAGVDIRNHSDLANAFSNLAEGNTEVGSDRPPVPRAASSNTSSDAATASGSTASTPSVNRNTDVVDQDISTQAGATTASAALEVFQKRLSNDLKQVKTIAESLRGAEQFALAGETVAARLSKSASSYFDPDTLAESLVSGIRSTDGDGLIDVHSSVDHALTMALLAQ